MIWYFREGLRPSIRVEIEQRGQELNSFEERVKKTIDAKAKTALRHHSYACKTDQHCFRASQLSAAKASTQGHAMKDPRVEEPKKPKESKALAPQHSDSTETSKQAWKEKKKKDRKYCGQKLQDSTPAIGINSTNTLRGHLSGSRRS